MGLSKKCTKTIKCKECNKELRPWRNSQKYCSLQCQHNYQWRLKKIDIEKGKKVGIIPLKRYLLEKLGNYCQSESCGWNSKIPIILEIEHIDGNSENNNLKNLTLLCPNCHSLTPTYKGRNRGNGRYARRKRYQEGKSY